MEDEVQKLNDDIPSSSSCSHPTTTAPEGASMGEVEAGFLAARAIDGADRRSTSRTRSADGKSFAEADQVKKEGKNSGKGP